MSIYVGDKKAVLYRGDYHPAQFYKGDVKLAGYDIIQKQGTEIEYEDTYNDNLDFTLYGKSEQNVTVQGKNLLDLTGIDRTQQGVTCFLQSDGTVRVDGTTVGKWWNSASLYLENRLTRGETYTFSMQSTVPQLDLIVRTLSVDGTVTYRRTVVFDNTVDTVTVYLQINDDGIGTNAAVRIQMEKGTVATTWEPFVPNLPSPDYPSPVNSSENFDVVSVGRNLIDCSTRKDYSGTTSTWNPDVGTLVVKGVWFTSVLIKLEADTDYHFSVRRELIVPVPDCGNVSVFVDTGLTAKDSIFVGGWSNFNFHTRAGVTGYQILFYSGAGNYGEVIFRGISVSKGTTIIPYQPYSATTAHITDPLRSVGNVSDSIEVSDGKVEVIRSVDRLTMTSSSNIVEHSLVYHEGYTHFRYKAYPTSISLFNETQCNVLPYKRFSWQVPSEGISSTDFSVYPTFTNVTLGISDTDTSTQKVSKLKSWLSTHEMYADVLPDTPTRTDITTTPLGQQLLSMHTVQGCTRIYTNADVPPHLMTTVKKIGVKNNTQAGMLSMLKIL